MMPVATPPNAIIFGTGRIQIGEMIESRFLAECHFHHRYFQASAWFSETAPAPDA